MQNDWTRELDRLKAENARLREALSALLDMVTNNELHGPAVYQAGAALEGRE